jgi:hypothetical protein
VTVPYRAYSYGYLLMAMHAALRRARAAERDPFVDCLNVLLHAALAAEAYLNHAGAQILPHWEPLKRKLSPREKLEVIAAARDISINWGAEPYQSFEEVVRFRNMVAHAETSEVIHTSLGPDAALNRSHWQTYCRLDVAERLGCNVESMIENLPGQLGLERIPAFLLAEASPSGVRGKP